MLAGVMLAMALAACSSAPKQPEQPDLSSPGDYAPLSRYLDARIPQQIGEAGIVGLSVALVDERRLIWSQGFGFSDLDGKIPATAETVYRTGSVAKLFTTALAMQQVEQGKMRLDQPIQRYLPDFSVRSRFGTPPVITPRLLMTHHAGLPANLLNGMWVGQPAPLETILPALKEEYLLYPPRYIYSYSNLGASVLGLALQRMTGQDFAALAGHALLQPLGMRQAAFATGLPLGKEVSRAYLDAETRTGELPLRDVPAGGLNASVNDLARFAQMTLAEGRIDGRRILKAETVAEMLRAQNADVEMDQGNTPVGLGWHLGRSFAQHEPMAEHSGATVAHRSLMRILPRQKLGVVILANTANAEGMIDELADEILAMAVEVKTGERPQPAPVPERASKQKLSEQEEQRYVGQYAGAFGYGTIEPGRRNLLGARRGLRAYFVDKRFDLFRRKDDSFGMKYQLIGLMDVTPHALSRVGVERRSLGGREVLLAHTPSGDSIVAEKIQPVPIPASWRARIGAYQVAESASGAMPDQVALIERDGFLMLQYNLPPFEDEVMAMPLKALSDTEAITLGVGNGLGYTVRVVPAPDGSERLRVLGYELQRQNAR